MSDIKLYQGDCLELMKDIPDHSVDLILCDLPYGTTACSWDSIIDLDVLWVNYNRILKDTGISVLFGSQPFTTKLIQSNYDNFRYEYIWVKNNCSNFQLSNVQPLKYHENICVFYEDIVQTVFSDIMQVQMKRLNLSQCDLQQLCLSKNGKPTGWVSNKLKGIQIPTKSQWHKLCSVFGITDEYDKLLTQLKFHTYNTDTAPTSVIQSNRGKAGKLGHLSSKTDTYIQTSFGFPQSVLYFDRESKPIHPTQKPLDLIEYLIKTYTNEGDLVLDNCMGAGTTGVACKHLDRDFIGIELDPNYFELAKQRIETTTFPIKLF